MSVPILVELIDGLFFLLGVVLHHLQAALLLLLSTGAPELTCLRRNRQGGQQAQQHKTLEPHGDDWCEYREVSM